jgi:hypothetical protein
MAVFCKIAAFFDAKMGKTVKKRKTGCQAIDSCFCGCHNHWYYDLCCYRLFSPDIIGR